MPTRIVLLWCLLVISTFPVRGQTVDQPNSAQTTEPKATLSIDPAKQADIRRLIELTGGKKIASQFMGMMENTIKPSVTNSLPAGEYRSKLVDLFFERLHSKVEAQLVDLALPLYDKYYSADEIKSLIQFYETPLGEKTISVMPIVMAEMQASGQKLGETAGRQSMIEIFAEHPDLAEALASAQKAARPQ